MIADLPVIRGTLVDVVTHVTGLVCLQPCRTLVVPCRGGSARPTSRFCRRHTHPKLTDSALPSDRGTG